MADVKPLVLDVDGTFLKTDMLFECFWAGLGKDPLRVVALSARNLTRPAHLKRELAAIADLRTDLLPPRPEIKDLAVACLARGREVVLASASDRALVQRLAADHGLSQRVFASDGDTNLKGSAKAKALVAAYGEGGFDYAGDDICDCAIWEKAENALIVGRKRAIEHSLARLGKSATTYPGGWAWRDLLRALRPRQWVRNLLLLLPLLLAQDLSAMSLIMVAAGIVAFSAAASAMYIVNDLLDLEADRLHAIKRLRSFASGAVPIKVGMIASALLGLAGLGLGAALGPWFLAVVMVYMVLSLAYSLRLKRMRWVDIAILAALDTSRVIAGAAVATIAVTGFMVALVVPIFVALASFRRSSELALADADGDLSLLGYGSADRSKLAALAWLGVATTLLVVLAHGFG